MGLSIAPPHQLNLYSHQVFAKYDFARINLPALMEDVVLITDGVEVGEEEPSTSGFPGDSPCQRRGEMAFHFFLIGKGTFQDQEVRPGGEVYNIFTNTRISGDDNRPSVTPFDSIPHASREMSHGFRRYLHLPRVKGF